MGLQRTELRVKQDFLREEEVWERVWFDVSMFFFFSKNLKKSNVCALEERALWDGLGRRKSAVSWKERKQTSDGRVGCRNKDRSARESLANLKRTTAPKTTPSCCEGPLREAPPPGTGLPRKPPPVKKVRPSESTTRNQESADPDAEKRRYCKLSAVRWRLRNGHCNHGDGAKHEWKFC